VNNMFVIVNRITGYRSPNYTNALKTNRFSRH
jgi:hypothetical protein